MKVKELIEELQKVDGELEVIMSSDAEGNSYSPLYSHDVCFYDVEAYCGDMYATEEEALKWLDNEDGNLKLQQVFCLWPS